MTQLLQVERLSKRYKDHHAVRDISFTLTEGSCVALLGPNGAGKTTTINMLTGLLEPTSGNIHLIHQGKKVEDRRPYLGYLPQMPVFYPWMTGKEFVQYAGELSGLSRMESVRRADIWLETVGLQDAGKRRIGGYSGGMKQRLGFAQALIHKPKLLILDEPVSALDPVGRREVLQLLKQIQSETTILFSTHVLHDAEEICDEIMMIRRGEIAVKGSLADIRAQYGEPVLHIELESEQQAQEWLNELKRKPFIQNAERNKYTLRLQVSDLAEAQRAILVDAMSRQLFIKRLEAGQSTLEDLFMKVVQE
ncbi:ABC transporter ATP-binding protein [Paenibacillus sp. N1-5-1-14]|uniref:ABC transporter ATP-binding protein n=1 Tax=Paenibacillus radicibacter TaxID=2972488 RepID=UPI0021596FE8|nr:ABC transporter ATP-binding protein [Paenibacillus radicibacter]MCR8645540.1 ABC transporter ATP-binding protein [Paenibacillus radicibacter]